MTTTRRIDQRIAQVSDRLTVLMAYLNGLEDARGHHAPQSRYLALSLEHQAAYGDGYRMGCALLAKEGA